MQIPIIPNLSPLIGNSIYRGPLKVCRIAETVVFMLGAFPQFEQFWHITQHYFPVPGFARTDVAEQAQLS